MISLHIMFTVAKFEARTLLRSWFFRVFSVLTLGLITLLDIALYAAPFTQWMHRGMSASVPYTNILLLNMAQAIIAVFMASEFLKSDRKLDTAESVYTRSMTNTAYVLGKTLGVLSVFFLLNLAALGISLVFNLFFTEVAVDPKLYLLYPLLLSLPALLFMLGLSFLAMVLVRNQAITFLLLLGYIAAVLLFLGGRSHGIFDFLGLHVPLMYSDFTGFGNLRIILFQRGMYTLLGITGILSTALLLRRLIQSRTMRAVTAIFTALTLGGAVILGSSYLGHFSGGKHLRDEMRALNRTLSAEPAVTLTAADISVVHDGSEIESAAGLSFRNDTDSPLAVLRFSLNPGFRVLRVTRGGTELAFERNLHTFTVTPSDPLAPGVEDSLTVIYRGAAEERACYLDLDEREREGNFRYWLFSVDRRYGFVTQGYVLLTEEDLWYPVAGIPHGAGFPAVGKRDFVRFSLAVKTRPELTAISQGAPDNPAPGEFAFAPESALPQISLIIGKYERRSVTAEGIEYSLYLHPGHDFFSKFFTGMEAQLPTLLDEAMFEYERQLALTYPFSRLTLIETPIQFTGHARLWKAGQETVQPEQILLPEKGVTIRGADFKQNDRMMSRMTQRGGVSRTPEEAQASLLRGFWQRTFLNNSGMMRNIRRSMAGGGFGGGAAANRLQRMAFSIAGEPDLESAFTLFPQFYTFVNHIRADRCPVLDTALQQYMMNKSQQSMFSMRFFQGTTIEEEANALLAEQSLDEVLRDPARAELAPDALRNKASYLFTAIRGMAGMKEFDTFLSDYLYAHASAEIPADSLSAAIRGRFGIDLDPLLESWYSGRGTPAYLLSDFTCREVTDGDRTRYLVSFTLVNTENVDGVVSITVLAGGNERGGNRGQRGGMAMGGPGMFMMSGASGDDNTRFMTLKGGEAKRFGMVLDSTPRRVTINTHISRNLPAVISRNISTPESGEGIQVLDGEQVLDRAPDPTLPGELVVDDEDSGFRAESSGGETLLKRLIRNNSEEQEQQYIALRFRNPPASWKATIGDSFYGSFRRTARYIRAGEGNNRAVWKANLSEGGRYEVYVYAPAMQMPMFGRGGQRGGPGGGQGGGQGGRQRGGQSGMLEEFHFVVHHDDGADEVVLDMQNVEEGWIPLGSYYFSEGPAEVELTDRTKGRVVLADAVKWVKRQDSPEEKK